MRKNSRSASLCSRLINRKKAIKPPHFAAVLNVEKVAYCHFFEFLRVSPIAFAPGRQNPQSTKTSGFSSVLTHTPRGPSLAPAGQFTLCRQSRMEHKGLRPLINPGVFRQSQVAEGHFFRCSRGGFAGHFPSIPSRSCADKGAACEKRICAGSYCRARRFSMPVAGS